MMKFIPKDEFSAATTAVFRVMW